MIKSFVAYHKNHLVLWHNIDFETFLDKLRDHRDDEYLSENVLALR